MCAKRFLVVESGWKSGQTFFVAFFSLWWRCPKPVVEDHLLNVTDTRLNAMRCGYDGHGTTCQNVRCLGTKTKTGVECTIYSGTGYDGVLTSISFMETTHHRTRDGGTGSRGFSPDDNEGNDAICLCPVGSVCCKILVVNRVLAILENDCIWVAEGQNYNRLQSSMR